MPRFDNYLLEIQRRNRLQPVIPLIRNWTQQEITDVEVALRAAITASNLLNSLIPNFAGSNQSKGNKAADYFVAAVSGHLPAPNRIFRPQGKGYPDQIFTTGAVGFFMEMKATSNWVNGNSNRRVLTSAPDKMRQLVNSGQVDNPPAHLICTVIYSDANSTVRNIRLDFVRSESPVNVRLEASTSQRLLTLGPHYNAII